MFQTSFYMLDEPPFLRVCGRLAVLDPQVGCLRGCFQGNICCSCRGSGIRTIILSLVSLYNWVLPFQGLL